MEVIKSGIGTMSAPHPCTNDGGGGGCTYVNNTCDGCNNYNWCFIVNCNVNTPKG